jgi:hypothetical protein
MQSVKTPIATLLEGLSSTTGLEHDRLARWAFVLSTAELRPYIPDSAERMRSFLDGPEGRAIARRAG